MMIILRLFFVVHAAILYYDYCIGAFLTEDVFRSGRVIPGIKKNACSDRVYGLHSRPWMLTSQWRKLIPPQSSITRQEKKEDGDQTQDPDFNSKSELVRRFVCAVEDSLQENKFVSLVLRGKKKKKKIAKNGSTDDDLLRGQVRQVNGRIIKVVSSKSKYKKKNQQKKLDNKNEDCSLLLFQITLKYHGATDICKNFPIKDVAKTIYNLILDPRHSVVLKKSEWGIQKLQNSMQGAQLTTMDTILHLRLDGKSLSLREQEVNKITDNTTLSAFTSAITKSHDRVKQVPLSNQAEFLKELGVTKDNGKPKPKMERKLRQCQKFVEIVGKIVDELQEEKETPIFLVDNGCGRAYLTFSLHSYLKERYESVTTTGIDVRPKLIKETNGIARGLGGSFDTLNFEEGTIENLITQASTTKTQQKEEGCDENSSLDILVALHACDTATDDALYSGIAQKADIIVVAPCCHKQIRPQLNAHFSSIRQNHELSSILKHGVYRDRMSETITDSLRALLLEYAGYKSKVFEFIGGEHTSKNVMITAIRDRSVNIDRKPAIEEIRQQIRSLAALYGIKNQRLAQWMELDLIDEESLIEHIAPMKAKTTSQLSKHGMPLSTRVEY